MVKRILESEIFHLLQINTHNVMSYSSFVYLINMKLCYFNVNNRLSDAILFIFSKFCYLCSHTRKRKTIKCFQSTLPIIYTIGRFCLTLSVIEKISIFCKLKDKKCILKLISEAVLIQGEKKINLRPIPRLISK